MTTRTERMRGMRDKDGIVMDEREGRGMTLTEFLLERIAEDEEIVRYLLGDYAEHAAAWSNPATGVVDVGDPGVDGLIPVGDGPLAKHISHWDPARVLAECEAKRRIVDFSRLMDDRSREFRERGERSRSVDDASAFGFWACLRLALPYADHPDYDEEWRP